MFGLEFSWLAFTTVWKLVQVHVECAVVPFGTEVHVRSGNPDPRHISTSYVERQNLTIRMGMRRYTRLTNAFSKKVEFHAHACSLFFMYYNFAKNHASLRVRYANGSYTQRTPAMAAGIATYPWSATQLAGLLD